MRIVFFGSPPFAEQSFRLLLEADFEVVALVTAPPRRAGRGRDQAANEMADFALARGLPVFQPESASDLEFVEQLLDLQADLGVVVSYGQILEDKVLAGPRLGCVNLHGSLLPRWRGASPVQAALLAGDSETGVCLQRMVRALDAGAVLEQSSLAISPHEDAPSLTRQLAEIGAALLVKSLAAWSKTGPPAGVAQEESQVTFCRRLHRKDALLDWGRSALELERQVRAMAGWPVAEARLPTGERLKIHSAHLADLSDSPTKPGSLVFPKNDEISGNPLFVSCGQGHLVLDQLQRPGKAILESADFLRGCPLKCGDVLGNGALES